MILLSGENHKVIFIAGMAACFFEASADKYVAFVTLFGVYQHNQKACKITVISLFDGLKMYIK